MTFRDIMDAVLVLATVVATLVAIIVARRKNERVKFHEPVRTTIEGEVDVRSKGRRFNSEHCDNKHKTLEDRIGTLEGYTKNEVGRIHDKIDLVERRGDDNLQASISELRETIRKVPLEIVDLLRKTGQMTDHC